MSDVSDDDAGAPISREEDILSFEIYFWIVRTINEKGFVKLSEVKKIHSAAVAKDKTVQYRSLAEILKLVNDNLSHWQGWSAVMQEDRITYVSLDSKNSSNFQVASETERTLGLLKTALTYVFVATKPSSKHPGVQHEELMTYLRTILSTQDDHSLTESQKDMLKKLIAPNARADFIKKGYLAFHKSVENDEEVFRYVWGPTARQTIDPVQLLQVFQKLTGVSPGELKEQTERANILKAEQLELIKRGVVLTTRGKADK